MNGYPDCLLKRGECLDGSKGPLLEDVKPHLDYNVVRVVKNIPSVDECAKECFLEGECRLISAALLAPSVASFVPMGQRQWLIRNCSKRVTDIPNVGFYSLPKKNGQNQSLYK